MSFSRLAWWVGALLMPAVALATPAARVIVKLKADSSVLVDSGRATALSADTPAQGQARMQRLGLKMGLPLTDGRQVGPRMHVAMAQGMSSAQLAARLARQADVEYAVVDQLRFRRAVPTDPYFTSAPSLPVGQWFLHAPNGTTPAAINAEGAWGLTWGLPSVAVAVLDTGVRLDHQDFSGKFLSGYNMIVDGARANNGIGRTADPSDLGDWLTAAEISGNTASYPEGVCTADATSSWHGMEVSGVVGAATNNGIGLAGVGGDSVILPVRVLGKCGGFDSDIIAGMRWAAGLPVSGVSVAPSQTARVINLSLGSQPSAPGVCSAAYQEAISDVVAAGVVVVASAGNSGMAVDTPANCPGVIAVGALRHLGTKAGYSATGTQIAISAPGGNCVTTSGPCQYPILSASNSGTTTPVADTAGGSTYAAGYGTSFSAPMVSGTVALMLAKRPTLSPAQVKDILMRTARTFPSSGVSTATAACTAPTSTPQDECYCTTSTCGAGMLDAGAAVARAASDGVATVSVSPGTPTTADTITLSGAGSSPSATGDHIVSYLWALVDGGGIVSALDGDLTAVSVTARARAAGRFEVRLTVTDDVGVTASTTQTVVVSTPPSHGGGGGGGGALEGPMLIIGAGWALWVWRTRRPHHG